MVLHSKYLCRSANDPASYMKQVLMLALLVAIGLELLVFNFPHWESLTYNNPHTVQYEVGPGLERQDDGTYTVANAEDAYIEFDMRGQHLDDMKLDLRVNGWQGGTWRQNAVGPVVHVAMQVTDEGHSLPKGLPPVEYCTNFVTTHYFRPHLTGGSNQIRVVFSDEGTNLDIGDVVCNVERPFEASLVRMLLVSVLCILIGALWPTSPLYGMELDGKIPVDKFCIALLVVGQTAVTIFAARIIGASLRPFTEYPTAINGTLLYDFSQYNHVADSIIAGRLTLDLPVSDGLRQLVNPYDVDLRVQELGKLGEQFYLDYAYYQGNYYSYFGVLPAVLTYVPFRVLFGAHIPTAGVVLVYSVVLSWVIPLTFYRLYRHYFERPNLGAYLLVELATYFGSGIIYLATLPQLYSVPILLGLICIHLAIWCWLGASDVLRERGTLSKPYLAIGGVFGALTLLCRPSYLLVSVVAMAIFWPQIFRDRLFFSKRGAGNTACVVLPFLVVGLVAMAYNHARFGSPLDFGATYNLTSENMTTRRFVLARVPACAFEFLFEPMTITTTFPFVKVATMGADYQGVWFYEPYVAGFFALSPAALAALLALSKRTSKLNVDQRRLTLTCLGLAAVVMALDSTVASITQRYHSDFAWAILVCAALVIWRYWEQADGPTFGKTVIQVLVIAGAVAVWMAEFTPGGYMDIGGYCPALYYFMKYKMFFLFM